MLGLWKKTKKQEKTVDHYMVAKDLAGCLFNFSYQSPAEVPATVKSYNDLYSIIKETHPTTIGPDGNTQQTTISAAERIALQAVFKKHIYSLLEKFLSDESSHTPAALLYGKVAEYNTRAKDREFLIDLYEKLLPLVESATEGSTGYLLVEPLIVNMCGNQFDKVERHLADFHCELAKLYHHAGKKDLAKIQYKKSCKLCPKIYGTKPGKINIF